MKLKFSSLFLSIFIFTKLSAQSPNPDQALKNVDRQCFIENKGQWAEDVLFLSRMKGLDVWITKTGVNYTFFKLEKDPNAPKRDEENQPIDKFDNHLEDYTMLGHRVIADYVGANTNPTREGKQKQDGYYNYLIGNDPSKHASFVGLYKEAVVKNVYDGIDIRYYFDRGSMRYDYIVQPGADPSQIKFRLRGQYEDYLKGKNVAFSTRFGETQMSDLYTYQEGNAISSHFVNKGDVWQIKVGAYDPSKTLVIDPLIYSTYLGGSVLDEGYSIDIDGSGNAYVTGLTGSADFDTTPGAFQTTFGGVGDVFVTKLNSTGNSLFYSTYIGGSSIDIGYFIHVDISGQVYITGETNSNNFDITAGAFQTTNAGGKDVFITKLNATGSGLIYSTYLGGSSNEQGYSITVDSSENAYVTGITESTNFDTTAGAFKTTNSGFMDVFATKINATGSSLIFSTYLGGSGYDRGHSIGLDANGNTYITGGTSSSNYDTTSGAFQTTYGGGADDIFVSKLNATGSVLLYSTYLGGSNNDFGRTLAIDGSGNAYITGFTDSPDFDTTAGAFQTTFGGSLDVFVSKLNASGTALIYSTFLGGSGQDVGRFIVLDGNENAYVSGNVTSTDFDITPGAFQTTNDGSWDVFVTQLNASGSGLLYSTYLGGSDIDYGVSIAIDGIGNVYSAGITNSTNFDITPGAFQTTNGGNYDVYVTKLGLSVPTSNIEYQTKLNSFSIYPNPTNGTFNILSEKGGVFELMDMAGRVLNTYKVNQGNYSIKEQLPTGMYLIRERESGSTLKLEVN